jgi:N-acetylglucosamine-6-phosphate deacetylase
LAGGQKIIVKQGQARLTSEVLASSVLTMDKAFKNLVTKVGISLPKAIQIANFNPAKCLGIDDKKR